VTEDNDGAASEELASFVAIRVAPLAKAFAQTPLMRIRVRTPEGWVTLEKSAHKSSDGARASAARPGHAPRIQEGEPGRAYDTINAETVGVFRSATHAAEFGERIEGDRILGYVEALKLRNPVTATSPCWFVAQAVEDGQAVEFGEVLFVVERGEAPPQPEAPVPAENGAAAIEPPRI
jgi:biotin carboxyl carrier protein